ncbi:MAG: aminoacyl-tRNA hydrolase [Clostridia bacterium]|nr:aminoacyl-tRNA hydrolase [Clostridia bacterium]
MILIVGLGNYGIEYAKTKHNVGFMVIDKLADENGFDISKKKCKSLIYEGHLFGEKVVVAKPQTYMNLSGQAVVELTNSFKPDKTLIIYDDFDLPFGTIRFRVNGSAGTHNGMRNIVELMGSTDIPRLRVGVKPEEKIYNFADYVLSKIDKKYIDLFEKSLDDACLKVKEFVEKKGCY